MLLFSAWISFWSTLMGLPEPRIEASPGLLAAAKVVDVRPTGPTPFSQKTILVRLKALEREDPRLLALHEMCHIRFATAEHGRDWTYCMQAYDQRSVGR